MKIVPGEIGNLATIKLDIWPKTLKIKDSTKTRSFKKHRLKMQISL